MRITRLSSSTLLLFLFVSGCVVRDPAAHAPIPREKFVPLYADLLIAGELGALHGADTTGGPASSTGADSILARYGVTEKDVRGTVQAYSSDVRLWKQFYEEVVQRLDSIQRQEGKPS